MRDVRLSKMISKTLVLEDSCVWLPRTPIPTAKLLLRRCTLPQTTDQDSELKLLEEGDLTDLSGGLSRRGGRGPCMGSSSAPGRQRSLQEGWGGGAGDEGTRGLTTDSVNRRLCR